MQGICYRPSFRQAPELFDAAGENEMTSLGKAGERELFGWFTAHSRQHFLFSPVPCSGRGVNNVEAYHHVARLALKFETHLISRLHLDLLKSVGPFTQTARGGSAIIKI